LNKGEASINNFLTKSIERGKLTQQDKDSTLARIKGTTNLKDFSDCDLVIEAITENMGLKKEKFAELGKICPKHTVLASNTSSLSIIDMGVAAGRPDKVLGLHFFFPVPLMNLMEIVRTIATSDETIEVGKTLGKSLNKPIIIAPDTPGFIVNRLVIPYLLTAIRALERGIGTKEDIDTGMHLGMGHPMGPIALTDFIGVDTVLFIADAMHEEFKEPMYAAPVLLRKTVTAGWMGRKSGKGFYEYK